MLHVLRLQSPLMYDRLQSAGKAQRFTAIKHKGRRVCSLQTCRVAQPGVDGVSLVISRAYTPPRYIGDVAVTEIAGRGLGLIATQNISIGDLLLCSQPLAVVLGPPEKPASNADLCARLLQVQQEPWCAAWLQLLQHVAAPATAQQDPQQQQQQSGQYSTTAFSRLSAAQQLLSAALVHPTASLPLPAASSDEEHTTAAPSDVSFGSTARYAAPRLTRPQMEQLVTECAYSDACEDKGAAALRELTPESVTGLWPEFSLLNHSCAPNAGAVVVGQHLLVRAVAPVLTGEELTISYLGAERLAPVTRRRAVLQGRYGFLCQCPRCLLEQSTFPSRYYPADDSLLGLQPIQPPAPSSSSTPPGGAPDGAATVTEASTAAATQLQPRQPEQQQQRFGWLWSSVDAALMWFGFQPRFTFTGRQLQPSEQYALLQQVYEEATTSLAIDAQDAIMSDQRATPRRLAALQQVCARWAAVNSAISRLQPWQLQPEAAAAKWLLASVFPLLQLQRELLEVVTSAGALPSTDELQALAEAAAGRSSTATGLLPTGWLRAQELVLPGLDLSSRAATRSSLCGVVGQQLEVVATVARGSELHLDLAVSHVELARQVYGPEADQTREAEAQCSAAHVARYGLLPAATLLALVAARRRQLLGASLAKRMSVIAWDQESAAAAGAGSTM